MKEFTLAVAIVVAGMAQVQAQTMPAQVPTIYPEQGMFCGFMELCTPKATAPRPQTDGVTIATPVVKQ